MSGRFTSPHQHISLSSDAPVVADLLQYNATTGQWVPGITAPVLFADGTEALPGIAFASQPSTGIWKPADGEIAISLAGVEKARFGTEFEIQTDLRLQDSGKVYLSKSSNLDYIDSALWTGFSGSVQTVENTGAGGLAIESNNAAGDISFKTNSLERMVILAAGRIGVGVSPPSNRLFVIQSPVSGGVVQLQLRSSTGYAADFYTATSGNLVITPGDTAIQTTKFLTGQTLAWTFTNSATSGNSGCRMIVATKGGSTGDPWISFNIGSPTNAWGSIGLDATDGNYKLSHGQNTNTSTFLSATTALDVGLGTDSPAAKLHVALDTGSLPTISASTAILLNNSSATGDIVNLSLVSGATGTASINFGDTATEVMGVVRYNNTADTLEWFTAGTSRALLSSTGWGVGVTALEKIHSSAKVRADTNFNCNGTDGLGTNPTVGWTDNGGFVHDVTICGGIVTSWLIDAVEQLV